MIGPGPTPNYHPPQYKATTRRRKQRLHGFATNHSGDWAPALHSPEYRENFDKIKWNRVDPAELRVTDEDDARMEAALKASRQDKGCCSSGCNCSNIRRT